MSKHFSTTSKEHNNYVAKMWMRADETIILLLMLVQEVHFLSPESYLLHLFPAAIAFQVATEATNFMSKNV